MARADRSDSESEEFEALEGSSSGEEDELENASDGHEQKKEIPQYEKQRLSRIAENKARMEALGLSKLASSLMASAPESSKRKGKRRAIDEDDDYRPDADDEVEGDDEDDGDDGDEYDEEFTRKNSSRFGRRTNKGSGSRKKPPKKNISSSDYVEDDEDLMKAIALSLQDSVGTPATVDSKKDVAGDGGKGKKKKPFTSRVQMTEDEMVIYFYQFDEAGKGSISLRNLKKMAEAHDFTWSDEEMADMIRCFDSDRDGKLSLYDFRRIVERCRMLKDPDGG